MDERYEPEPLRPEIASMITSVNEILIDSGAKEFAQRYLADNIKLWHATVPVSHIDIEAEKEFQEEMDFLKEFLEADLPYIVESMHEDIFLDEKNNSRLHLSLAKINPDGTMFNEGALPDLIFIEPLTFKGSDSESQGQFSIYPLHDLDGTSPVHSEVLIYIDERLATGIVEAFNEQEKIGWEPKSKTEK